MSRMQKKIIAAVVLFLIVGIGVGCQTMRQSLGKAQKTEVSP